MLNNTNGYERMLQETETGASNKTSFSLKTTAYREKFWESHQTGKKWGLKKQKDTIRALKIILFNPFLKLELFKSVRSNARSHAT